MVQHGAKRMPKASQKRQKWSQRHQLCFYVEKVRQKAIKNNKKKDVQKRSVL
jgi:hypothetical protein